MTRAARRAVGAALVLLLLVAVTAHAARLLARSRTTQLFGRLVDRVETPQRVVALTFDDGPNSATVEALLAPLAQRGVKATFFVNGVQLERHPDAGRRLVAAGHQLGNHSFSHRVMVLKSPAFIREEIESTDRLIRAAGFEGPIRFRPPNGYKLVLLPWFLQRTGRTSVTWDVEPESYADVKTDPDAIVRHTVEHARPGSIVLLHPWYAPNEPTRVALPALLDGLAQRGFRLVTVDELLALRETQ